MTCDEYLAVLATAPVEELARNRGHEHTATCVDCERVTRVVVEREWHLATTLDDLYSNRPPAVTAANAIAMSRQRRVQHWFWFTVAAAVAGAVLVSTMLFPRTEAAIAAQSQVEQMFLLRCLSAAQAGALTRPLLAPDGMSIFSGEPGVGVFTVRGSQEQLEKVRTMLDRYEGAAPAACPSGVAVPPVPPGPPGPPAPASR